MEKSEIIFLGITDVKRKKLLVSLIDKYKQSKLSINEAVLALSFALLRSNKLIKKNWKSNEHSKIDNLLSSWIRMAKNQKVITKIYSQYEIENLNDDILGAFYQSIQSISRKSHLGSYYTPSELLKNINVNPKKTILDPCCGSGGILMNVLSKEHDPSKIFARDIDEIALNICFINLSLFFNDNNIAANIQKKDIAQNNNDHGSEQFDYIITNPPWGSKFSKKEKKKFILDYPELETSEIFSISLYNSLKKLKKNGDLFFFLPHSFLNVTSHKNIRKYVFKNDYQISVKLLGNAFKGVMSESILMNVQKKQKADKIIISDKSGKSWFLPLEKIAPPDYLVSATTNNQDSVILEKIFKTEYVTLQNNADFALGIVTGNNKKYLLEKSTKKAEPVYRGKEIGKYEYSKPEYYIKFNPELFQQVAPEEYFRQKKIVYRFICDRIICVLDNDNSLLLNSANLFIPKNYPFESVVSFFNSDIYTFMYRKMFHSRKVLKSHLQSLPLPVVSDDTHKNISNLYKKCHNSALKDWNNYQEKIDDILCKIFKIDKKQYSYIIEAKASLTKPRQAFAGIPDF